MSLLPQGAVIDSSLDLQEITQPSKTYKIDFEKGRIVGLTDGVEALKQTIRLILSTERYEYLIYSWDYGSELKGAIGRDKEIAESEFKRRIKEALTQDDRITNVDNFIFNYHDKDGVNINFTVFSIYGEFESGKLVSR